MPHRGFLSLLLYNKSKEPVLSCKHRKDSSTRSISQQCNVTRAAFQWHELPVVMNLQYHHQGSTHNSLCYRFLPSVRDWGTPGVSARKGRCWHVRSQHVGSRKAKAGIPYCGFQCEWGMWSIKSVPSWIKSTPQEHDWFGKSYFRLDLCLETKKKKSFNRCQGNCRMIFLLHKGKHSSKQELKGARTTFNQK